MKTIALLGAPNTGKSTMFNGLTGGRAKTGNYSGVTVEKRTGFYRTEAGEECHIVDLPGVYGLYGRSMDEKVSIDVLKGHMDGEDQPDLVLAILDAGRLDTHLQSILQFRQLGLPMVLCLNMIDLAKRDGLEFDLDQLSVELQMPVIATNAARAHGREELESLLDGWLRNPPPAKPEQEGVDLQKLQREARALARQVTTSNKPARDVTRTLDQIALHPVFGVLILAALLFFMFQAVYSWSAWPMDMIDGGVQWLAQTVDQWKPAWLASLLGDGIIAGVGAILVFLPQILILFAFILILEASGYMARAAFLVDGLMSKIGLNGRAFIPLLSSFACAVPGIMSARTMESERDRLTTIMIAPLMTCSARIPVYALIIGAFIPDQAVGPFNLKGLVLFCLYLAGIVFAIIIAFILKRTATSGESQHLLLEMPGYKMPNITDLAIGVFTRAWVFLRKAGTIIFTTSVILWVLTTYPVTDAGIRGSFAGMIGSVLEPIFRPIGFSLETVIALVPGMAAREVVVAAMGTVYSVSGNEEQVTQGLAHLLQSAWTLPSALAFLAWYVFAPQCFATIAVVRRETNSLKWTLFMVGYLFALAWIAAFATYHIASLFA